LISVDSDKEGRLRETLAPLGGDPGAVPIGWTSDLGRDEVADLVAMGPNAGRLDEADLEAALDALEYPVAVTFSVNLLQVTKPETGTEEG
jgi:hypothetical protein